MNPKERDELNTREATECLARYLRYIRGWADWPDEEDPYEESEFLAHLRSADDAGRRWAWDEAGKFLSKAYKALEAKPPLRGTAAGRAWHCGDHPIQVEARRLSSD